MYLIKMRLRAVSMVTNMLILVNNTVLYLKVAMAVYFKSSHHERKVL